MRGQIIFGVSFHFAVSIAPAQSWMNQSSGVATSLNAIHCFDSNTCYAVGDSCTTLKTENGGVVWSKGGACFSVPDSCSSGVGGSKCAKADSTRIYHRLRSVYFATANSGFAIGDSSTVLKTTNRGNAWRKINWPPKSAGLASGQLNSISCSDSNHCWVVAQNGSTIRTVDGGANWTALQSMVDDAGNAIPSDGYTFQSISCTDSTTCFKAGHTSASTRRSSVFKTIKSKSNLVWTVAQFGNTVLSNLSVTFVNKNTGYSVGYDYLGITQTAPHKGLFTKTTDGGLNWTTSTSEFVAGQFPISVSCQDSNTCYMISKDPQVSDPTVSMTQNGGADWLPQNIDGIVAIHCPDSKNCYGVGKDGSIMKKGEQPTLIMSRSLTNLPKVDSNKRHTFNILGRILTKPPKSYSKSKKDPFKFQARIHH